MEGKKDNELKLIKDFITKINNSVINNKNEAANEFRKLKQKVMNDRLKQDLIKYLEKYLFGENLENIKPRDDKAIIFAPPSPPKEDYAEERNDYLKYIEEEEEKDRKKFSDEYESNGWSIGSVLNKKGKGLKTLTKKQLLNRLPLLLAQMQAGNNSIKLKNEIRQILYSLYRSKVLTKTVYNNLIKVIRA